MTRALIRKSQKTDNSRSAGHIVTDQKKLKSEYDSHHRFTLYTEVSSITINIEIENLIFKW